VQPDPDYESAKVYLKKQADSLGLPCKIINICEGHDAVIFTWEGTEPSLPSILLNSHIDVVPVFPEHWKYDPFEAVKDENGDIFARGSQDMKCVGIQYIEAVRRMKAQGVQLKRTLHLCFVPDEEVGGKRGMELFVTMPQFKDLNVGFALDEGLANPTDAFTVFYGERSPWWVHVTATGPPGHGSRFIEGSAGEKMRKVIDKFMDFRDSEENRLKSDPNKKLGDVTTVNMTILGGGVQPNVVPAELTAVFDIRVTPTVDLEAFEEQLRQWCKDVGEGVHLKFLQQFKGDNLTTADDSNPWWKAFSSAANKLGIEIDKEIFPAATDSRFIRRVGIPAIGFSPMNKTPILLHDHNEFLNEKIFLRGIEIYLEIIPSVANA